MIIRKPYAFLIKNFRKVHIFLFVLSLYTFFKLLGTGRFINEFISLGVYDNYNEPITKHITLILTISVILLMIGSFALMLLLKRKDKPWKIYLFSFIEYFLLFLVLGMISSFFKGFNGDVSAGDIRLLRDFLTMLLIGQFVTILIFIMRIIGVDINKFNFTKDQEFLELSEEDREEVELRVKFDKNIFIRTFNKLIRNLRYFYLEHKLICNIIVGIFTVVICFNMFIFIFVTNKSYSQGDNYKVDGYTIKINKSYFTDKDYKGDIISKNSSFVILDLTVENNSQSRTMELERFHLKSGISDYTTERKTYEKEFQDLGEAYDSAKRIDTNEKANFIIVYKVSNKLRKNSFVLYYQEHNGKLRKIKLKVEDISKIIEKKNLKLGEEMKFEIRNKKEKVSLEKYAFSNSVNYSVRICSGQDCRIDKENYKANSGYKILKIDFTSLDFEGKEMVDFSHDYGKIVYIDNSKMEQYVTFKYPLPKKSVGKYIYTLVPDEVEKSETLRIIYVVRNKQYTYNLK